jgi:hypothetical protein
LGGWVIMMKNLLSSFESRENVLSKGNNTLQKIREVRKFCKELGIEDMLDDMNCKDRLDYHFNLLNFKDNVFCAEIDLETELDARTANILANFTSKVKVEEALKDEQNLQLENIYLLRNKLLEERTEQPIQLNDLIHLLWTREYDKFVSALENLFLEALNFKLVKTLVWLIDKDENFTKLERLYEIHMKNPTIRYWDIIEILLCKDVVVDIDLNSEEIDIMGITDDEVGSRLVRVADGIMYFLKKVIHDKCFDEDIIEDSCWVLI